MRLIDADELKEQMLDTPEHEKDIVDLILEALVAMIDEQPTIEERKMGKWIEIYDADEYGEPYPSGVTCSECGFCSNVEDNFCPNCGADMRDEK